MTEDFIESVACVRNDRVEKNNYRIIDFVGKKGNEAFKGGSAKDYKLTLGSHTFIPGFEEGIVGHEPGDKFNLKLTFPKDYGVADLAGAKTVFEVLLKQVNEVVKPKIDDTLAEKCGFKKTTFYSAFAKKEGCTPAEWLARQGKKR